MKHIPLNKLWDLCESAGREEMKQHRLWIKPSLYNKNMAKLFPLLK